MSGSTPGSKPPLISVDSITPLCGVVFSHLLRGDTLGLSLIAGAAAIATGVLLVNRQPV